MGPALSPRQCRSADHQGREDVPQPWSLQRRMSVLYAPYSKGSIMLSRIMWITVAGLALFAGMALQNDWAFGWGDDSQISERTERRIEEKIDRAIDHSFDKMTVVESNGREIELPAETKRAMAAAVGELVKAETDFAMARIGEENDKEVQAASARRDKARAEVKRLKTEIEALEEGAQDGDAARREQIRREVREDVRATVREAVGS